MEDFGIKAVDEEQQEYIRESPKLLGATEIPDNFQ
jgi:hypothetical protein